LKQRNGFVTFFNVLRFDQQHFISLRVIIFELPSFFTSSVRRLLKTKKTLENKKRTSKTCY